MGVFPVESVCDKLVLQGRVSGPECLYPVCMCHYSLIDPLTSGCPSRASSVGTIDYCN